MRVFKCIMVCLIALVNFTVYAQTPEVQRIGDISYIAGGIGSDESDAIQAESKKWPLLLQFSQIDEKGWGSWISSVKVRIFDSQKREIFNTICDGPFLLLDLNSGEYIMEFTYNDVIQKKIVTIKPKQPEKLSIYWR